MLSAAQQRRRFSRRQRHIELMQGQRKTLTRRLDVSLFARPAVKECLGLHGCRERAERRHFPGREEMSGDLLTGEIPANVFKIDADLAVTSDDVKRQLMRVRYVKA